MISQLKSLNLKDFKLWNPLKMFDVLSGNLSNFISLSNSCNHPISEINDLSLYFQCPHQFGGFYCGFPVKRQHSEF